jgi:hypothetical protein
MYFTVARYAIGHSDFSLFTLCCITGDMRKWGGVDVKDYNGMALSGFEQLVQDGVLDATAGYKNLAPGPKWQEFLDWVLAEVAKPET